MRQCKIKDVFIHNTCIVFYKNIHVVKIAESNLNLIKTYQNLKELGLLLKALKQISSSDICGQVVDIYDLAGCELNSPKIFL